MMHRLRHRLPHQAGGADGAVEPRVIAHLDDGRDAAPLLADQFGIGAVEFDLARGVRFVAELVLEPVDVDRVALAVRRPARHQETAQALRRVGEDEEGVAHRRRHEPFVTVKPEAAVSGLGAGDVGAQVGAALVLGHAHADERGSFLARRAEMRIVVVREDAWQPFLGDGAVLPQRRYRTVGHGQRAQHAAFDLAEHVAAGRAQHMRARLRIGPRARMQAALQRQSHQRVPCGMKLDLIQTMTETVEGLELRWKTVGGEAERDGLRQAELTAEAGQPALAPVGAFARDGLTQHEVAGEEVVAFERRRLVLDLEHVPSSSRSRPGRTRLMHATIHGNSATWSRPVVSGQPMIRFMFWIAWPDAPFTRLSSAAIMIARPSRRSLATPMKVMLEPRTCRVCGVSPNGSTCTNGSFA